MFIITDGLHGFTVVILTFVCALLATVYIMEAYL